MLVIWIILINTANLMQDPLVRLHLLQEAGFFCTQLSTLQIIELMMKALLIFLDDLFNDKTCFVIFRDLESTVTFL